VRASVSDREQLQSLDLVEIASYLQAKGWQRTDSGYERAVCWSFETKAGEVLDVLVPTDATVGDFVLRMSELLQALEQVEQRSQMEILSDIQYARSDVVRLRQAEEENAVGGIPLVDGEKLIGEAVTLMTAAACAAIYPGRVMSAKQASQASEYLQHVKMGQTERGSFVLTIVSPLVPLITPGVHPLFDSVDEPFPRKVTKTLAEALGATRMAITKVQSSGQFEIFEEAVGHGVSANFCEAISGLLAAAGQTGRIGVDVAWAPTLPSNVPELRPIEFAYEEVSVLNRAARFLRELSPGEGVPIAGVVIRLAREQDAEDGTATILGVVGGAIRRIAVPLRAADYEMAIDAHRDKKGIRCLADIKQIGRKYEATNVAEFRLQE
jgi:hypothetical protein